MRPRVREKALKAKPQERGGVNNAARMRRAQAGKRESLGTTLESERSGCGRPAGGGSSHLDCAEGARTPGESVAARKTAAAASRNTSKESATRRGEDRGYQKYLGGAPVGGPEEPGYGRRLNGGRGTNDLDTTGVSNTLNERATPRREAAPTATSARRLECKAENSGGGTPSDAAKGSSDSFPGRPTLKRASR